MKNKEVKVVRCFYCDRIIGYRIRYKYSVDEGVVQWGSGQGSKLKSFCNQKCSVNYRSVYDALDRISARLEKLEKEQEAIKELTK